MNIELTNDKFKEFLRCLSILKDDCNDVNIMNGFIRQRTNTYSCLFEIDLTPLIGSISIPISALKQKLDILKTFNKCDVNIIINDTSYSFSDNCSIVTFDNPKSNFMDNKYIPIDDYNNMIELNPEDLIMRCTINQIITDRIKIISKAFNMDSVKIVFDKDQASIVSTSYDKGQNADFLRNIEINKEMNCHTNIIIVPFIIDHDDGTILNIYENNDSCICQFENKLSDINIKILTKSPFLEEEF